MKKEAKEITMEELVSLIQSQQGEFVIHVEFGEGGFCGEGKSISA